MSLVLIGPYGVGKTTIAKLVAEQLGLPQYSLDELADKYREGFAGGACAALHSQAACDSAALEEWHVYLVTTFLDEHAGEASILDLGAGHALFSEDNIERVSSSFDNHFVVLLMPSNEPADCHRYLAQRNGMHPEKSTKPHLAWNRYFLAHASPALLADSVVYLKERTPNEVALEIVNLIKLASPNKSRKS
jgi:adenylate kinase family enzyme